VGDNMHNGSPLTRMARRDTGAVNREHAEPQPRSWSHLASSQTVQLSIRQDMVFQAAENAPLCQAGAVIIPRIATLPKACWTTVGCNNKVWSWLHAVQWHSAADACFALGARRLLGRRNSVTYMDAGKTESGLLDTRPDQAL
jgi:hypothetical protein